LAESKQPRAGGDSSRVGDGHCHQELALDEREHHWSDWRVFRELVGQDHRGQARARHPSTGLAGDAGLPFDGVGHGGRRVVPAARGVCDPSYSTVQPHPVNGMKRREPLRSEPPPAVVMLAAFAITAVDPIRLGLFFIPTG
jgi:hypothetical protein